jgi:hypothetical protein
LYAFLISSMGATYPALLIIPVIPNLLHHASDWVLFWVSTWVRIVSYYLVMVDALWSNLLSKEWHRLT